MFNRTDKHRRDPITVVPIIKYIEGTMDLTASSRDKVELEEIVKGNVLDLIKQISDIIDRCNCAPYTEHTFMAESVLLRTYIELIEIYPSIKQELKISRKDSMICYDDNDIDTSFKYSKKSKQETRK